MKKFSTLLSLLSLVAACGGNPVKVAKERDRSDERRRSAETSNKELEDKNAQLETTLKNARSTTNAVWAVVTIASSYEKAESICADLDFALPTTAEIAEFKSEIYDRQASWQKIGFERFFKKDVVEDQTDSFGFVLCRRALAKDVFQP